MSERIWAESFARELAGLIAGSRPAAVTWLNHYTVRQAMKSDLDLSEFEYVGVDGTLLRLILGKPLTRRTSADLVLPIVLSNTPHLRVGIIGGTEHALASARRAISELMASGSEIVFARNGYDSGNLPASSHLDLLIVGMGAPKQDFFALSVLAEKDAPRLTVTCGGWLDQIGQKDYYPPWAYSLKLNWLVRVAREPRRLWKRYTLDALSAIANRKRIRRYVGSSEAFKRYASPPVGSASATVGLE